MSTVDIAGEYVSLEELSKAWGYYKRFRDYALMQNRNEDETRGFILLPKELFKEIMEANEPLQAAPLVEPDPQGL